MRNIDKIVHTLRTAPGADVTSLMEEDASALLERVLTGSITAKRQHIVEFMRTVHLASSQVTHREHSRRTKAELDAADSRARLSGALRTLRDVHARLEDLRTFEWGAADDEDPAEVFESLIKDLSRSIATALERARPARRT